MIWIFLTVHCQLQPSVKSTEVLSVAQLKHSWGKCSMDYSNDILSLAKENFKTCIVLVSEVTNDHAVKNLER